MKRLLIFGLVLLGGCATEKQIVYVSRSPDGSADLRVTYFGELIPITQIMRLEISRGGRSRLIKEWKAKEIYPCFIAATWSRSSDSVVAMIRDCWHSPAEFIAFNRRTGRVVAPDEMLPDLANAIRFEYHLPADVVPLTWARSEEAVRVLGQPHAPGGEVTKSVISKLPAV